jgi:predicted NUDIX family NTP pyrophosphohydrolase
MLALGPFPKGECSEGEDALSAAKREFAEETGVDVEGDFLPLGEVRQAGGKIVLSSIPSLPESDSAVSW